VRIPIKATAREPIKQAGYISATSAIHAQSLLRNAAGPYIRVKLGSDGIEAPLPVFPQQQTLGDCTGLSVLCQKQTLAQGQTTFDARTTGDCGRRLDCWWNWPGS
jgi:hypothetical protein